MAPNKLILRLIHNHSKERNLDELSALGHFLKGSSATLGMTKVKDSCEKIQHYGARKDASGTETVSDDDLSLDRIQATIKQAKTEYKSAQRLLRAFYGD